MKTYFKKKNRKKKYKIKCNIQQSKPSPSASHLQNHKKNSEIDKKVDEETAKMVENLKLRLKTLDQDLERVKQAALKINDEFNLNDHSNNAATTAAAAAITNNEKHDDEHLSRANSFVYDDDQNQQVPSIKPIVADLRMAEWYVCIMLRRNMSLHIGSYFETKKVKILRFMLDEIL